MYRDFKREIFRPKFTVCTTETLKIDCKYEGFWIGGCWKVENASGGYHGLLKKWWDHFGLKGKGLIIGEEGIYGENIKRRLKETYSSIEVFTVGLEDADIVWDITKPPKSDAVYDWIICQAVLEHVKDPASAIKNLADTLKEGGYIYIHTHGPEFGYHAYPIDCYRFFRDALIALAELNGLEIADILWEPQHCFVVYKKGKSKAYM